MRAFEIHPPKPPAPKSAPPKPRRRWLLAGLFLLLLGVGWWAFRPDPRMAKARALQAELFANRQPGPPTEERKAKMQEFRETMGKLSDEQKRELFEPLRQKQKEEFDRYFTLGPQEKAAYLDRLIDRSQKARHQGGQKAGGGKGPSSPDEIEARKKKMLDRTTPEDRAKRDQFRRELDARRKQRGLRP